MVCPRKWWGTHFSKSCTPTDPGGYTFFENMYPNKSWGVHVFQKLLRVVYPTKPWGIHCSKTLKNCVPHPFSILHCYYMIESMYPTIYYCYYILLLLPARILYIYIYIFIYKHFQPSRPWPWLV